MVDENGQPLAVYKIPSKIPADTDMKRELKLRKRFKEEQDQVKDEKARRPLSDFNIWFDYELDAKAKQVAFLEEVFRPVEGGKPVDFLLDQLSAEELEVIQTTFFPKLNETKPTESVSTQTSGVSTPEVAETVQA